MDMQFSWDRRKSETNLRKHGLSFEIASLVFDDPFHLSRQDRVENGELRWQTLGMIHGLVLVLVAHTWHDNESGVEHVRIISARRATNLERRIYERHT